jgi:hypothetical protein
MAIQAKQSPAQGRKNLCEQKTFLPSLTGLVSCCFRDPALKRWAIVRGKGAKQLLDADYN